MNGIAAGDAVNGPLPTLLLLEATELATNWRLGGSEGDKIGNSSFATGSDARQWEGRWWRFD